LSPTKGLLAYNFSAASLKFCISGPNHARKIFSSFRPQIPLSKQSKTQSSPVSNKPSTTAWHRNTSTRSITPHAMHQASCGVPTAGASNQRSPQFSKQTKIKRTDLVSRLLLIKPQAPTRAEANIIYLDRPDWKSPSNKYRQAPWKLTSVPTILKFDTQDAIVARIQDDDILDRGKVAKFLGEE